MLMDPRYTEFRVVTECGRNFVWSALDRDRLERDLEFRGYRAKHIELHQEEQNTEYPYQQQILNVEHGREVEKWTA